MTGTMFKGMIGFALALTLGALAACTQRETEVRINVQVRTNQGEPVAGAVVAIDGKAVGETNNLGTLQGMTLLTPGARAKVEVRKDSDRYYFAPFYEAFTVSRNTPQDVMVAATLYFVPKPEKEREEKEAKADLAAVMKEGAKEEPKPEAAAPPAPAAESAPEGVEDLQAVVAQADDEPAAADEDEADAALEAAEEQVAAVPAPIIRKQPEVKSKIEGDLAERMPPVSLAPVALDADAPAKAAAPAKPEEPQPVVFTVLAFDKGAAQPLEGVEITLGDESDLGTGCTTNARGRCVVRFPTRPEGTVTFVAAKTGFKTESRAVRIGTRQTLRFEMEHGRTIDIYALSKTFNHTVGLADVEVFVGGKKVGNTDKFGRYSVVYDGKPDDLVAIGLKPRGHLPESFETDFVASGPMKLVRYFTPAEPPPARLAVVGVAVDPQLEEAVRVAARKHVFSSAAFKEYPLALLERAATKAGKTRTTLLKDGWQGTDMKADVDAILLPTLIPGKRPTLELAVVDSKAQVVAAAQEELDDASDKASIERAVATLAKKIARSFPFEGVILGKEADKVTVNIGYASGRGIKVGDVLEVYGVQSSKAGTTQQYRKIAVVTVREVQDRTSKGTVTQLAARAVIERGDLVAMRARKAPQTGGAQVRVVAGSTSLPQANVYFNDQWLGATDADGRLYLDVTGTGTLKVIKHGFKDHAKPVSIAQGARVDVTLARESAFLRIDSRPTQATVRIDGKVVGKTPLAAPVAVPAGFVKLEVGLDGNGAGFKRYSAVLELDQGTLDLTGANAIALEPDLRGVAQRLLKAGKTDEAAAKLAEIPPTHSDYLLARHELGELYLTVLDDPAKAAAAFGEVTANEAVREFSDKRFVGSHIDEGVALFLTAERLGDGRKEEAAAHYKKAIEVFDRVIPQLRFVPSEQYGEAVHNVDFHRALARHRLWSFSQDPGLLADTVKMWRSYLDGSARSVGGSETSKAYVENAEVYYKQAIASMGGPKGVSAQ